VKVLCGIPVKPFGAAKGRLATVLPSAQRRELSRRLAAHTVEVVAVAGAVPLILAGDDEVGAWAETLGVEVSFEEGADLNRAAAAAVRLAHRRNLGWLICHADLALLTSADLTPLIERVASGGWVIAASSDGGTTVIGGNASSFRFAYGAASFHRHLQSLTGQDPSVHISPGLSIDLDGPADLSAVRDQAAWMSLGLDTLPDR
jgi:2-phospho-L-lactate guanylyltransferase